MINYHLQGSVSRNSRKLFGPGKSFVELRPAYSVKLVFSYVVKGIKIKITAKFRASSRLRFEDTNRIVSPEMRPKSFGTFEKRAPVPSKNMLITMQIYSKSHVLHLWQHGVVGGSKFAVSLLLIVISLI